MAYLSKQKVTEILRNRPEGVAPEEVIAALQKQGHTIEGYNDNNTTDQKRAVAQQEDKKNTVRKVADFLGVGKAGEAVGRTLATASGSVKMVEEGAQNLDQTQTKVMQLIKEKKARGEDTSRLEAGLKDSLGTSKQLAGDIADIGTGGLSNKEVLGSIALTAGNLALPFAGKTLQIGSKAVKIPALADRIVRGQGALPYLKSLGVNVAKSAAVGGAFGAASGAEQNKDTEGMLRSAAVGLLTGAAFPVAIEGIRAGAKAVGSGAKLMARTFSGTPTKAIDYAIEHPAEARQGIANATKDEKTVFKVANAANKAAENIKARRDTVFKKGIEKLQEKLRGQTIDPTPFNEKMASTFKKFDLLDNNGNFNLRNSAITDDREARTLQKIVDRMQSQEDLTPMGYWRLKQFISNQYRPTASGAYNAIVTDLGEGLRDVMTKNVKGFDKLLGKYEAESQLLTYLQKELGVKANTRGVTVGDEGQALIQDNTKRVINALMRSMKDNQPLADELIKELERVGGKQIMGDLSGLYFASWIPPQLQSVLGLGAGSVLGVTAGIGTAAKAAPLAAFASPQLVGRGAALAGDITRGLRNIPPQLLENAGQAVRQAAYGAGVRNVTK